MALAPAALPGGAVAVAQTTTCTVPNQNRFVRDVLFEYYLWYRELPVVNPASYPSPEAYLDAVRYRTLDSTFTYIANRAEQEAFYSDSQFIGLGVSTQFDGVEMRVSQVYPGSPASEAGLARGDRILAINGRTVPDLYASGLLGTAFGASQEGVQVALQWRPTQGAERSATLSKRPVTIPTVSMTRLYEVDGRKVGYLLFRNFVRPSFDALDAAFTDLKAAGATELVLDLRYNGGGLVDVAQHLGGLVGGVRTQDRLFAEFFHNDRNPQLNRSLPFEPKPNALDLQRLFVITTRASASASELVINALRPFIPVVVVGDRTYGKPVGQYGFTFCDKVLNAVSFILRNANGEADFFSGFAPTCAAADDLDRQFGDPAEASLREAFTYLRTGACTPAADGEGAAARRLSRRPILPADGWQQLVGAH
jgi:carboxyl-terminal processing protease